MDIDKLIDDTKKEIEGAEQPPTKVPSAETHSSQLAESPSEQLKNLQQDFLKKQIDSGKTLNEITNDFAHATTTSEIFSTENKENTAFKRELKEEKKEAIKETFKKEKISNQTLTLEEKQKKAEAFYKSFRPILEFDFSNLIGKKNSTPTTQNTSSRSGSDNAYGIPLMCLMLFLYTLPFCVISLILAVFNGINAIFSAIANFGKIARTICYSLFIIAILTLIAYLAILGVEHLFGIQIFARLGI